jgi:rSAM/selenodomain-associated transferase 1
MRTAVVIMSRIPQPGFTKTRLQTMLSEQECADFHRACLFDICRAVRESALPGYIYFAPPSPNIRGEDQCLRHSPYWDLPAEEVAYFTMCPQQGSDLGERLYNAAQETLQRYDSVILLGCDIPELSPALLLEAQVRLIDCDIVIGPSVDGGYYLIGIKRAAPDLFQDIPWGTAGVLEKTLEKIQAEKCTVDPLELKADVDTWDDLVAFFSRGQEDDHIAYQHLFAYVLAEKLVNKYGNREGGCS